MIPNGKAIKNTVTVKHLMEINSDKQDQVYLMLCMDKNYTERLQGFLNMQFHEERTLNSLMVQLIFQKILTQI